MEARDPATFATGLNPRALEKQLPAFAGRGLSLSCSFFAREGGGRHF